jgi:ribonuclease HI
MFVKLLKNKATMQGQYQLYTDGSYNPYTNMAGYGGYLLDPEGNTVFEFSEVIENSQFFKHHESLGLEKGLSLCLEYGVKKIHSYTDAKQMALVCNTKDVTIRKLYTDRSSILKRVEKLIVQFEEIDFTYVPRRLNSRADRLSHKAINERQLKNPVIESIRKFKSPSIDFSKNYSEKTDFINIHKKIENCIIIDSTNGVDYIKVYHVKKDLDSNTITSQLVHEVLSENKTAGLIAECFNHVLNNMPEIKNCILYAQGGGAHAFESVIKGVVSLDEIGTKASESFEKLEKTLAHIEKAIYHFDIGAMNKVFNPNMKKPKTKEEIIEALKILGDENYVVGTHKEIEGHLFLKDSQKANPVEIQKKYFAEFLKISMKDLPLSEKIHPQVKAQENREKLEKIREELHKKGVRLRI